RRPRKGEQNSAYGLLGPGSSVRLSLRAINLAKTLNKFNWERFPEPDPRTVARMAGRFDIPTAAARFLLSREFDTESALEYLDPTERRLHDPFLFEAMERAVECVCAAVETNKRILVHGDYDVDGICGTALLYHFLRGRVPHVFRFLPDRRKDGYGIADRAVDWAVDNGVGLFIAVDCGTSDGELIQRLESEGIDVIVCDHHEYPADGDVHGIILNPSNKDDRYPFRGLCGTGVAFKLIAALESRGVSGGVPLGELVDLFALATIGDLSPLADENRYLVREGLKLINTSGRVGLDALKNVAGLDKPEINSYHIGFVLAPRLNAPGRLSNPKPALEILCTDDKKEAADLARVLEADNKARKLLTEKTYGEAREMIDGLADRDERGGFVLAAEGWNEGVLGIVASRIVDEFGKAAVLISVEGDTGKGSGRSIPGIHLKDQLDRCGSYLVRYGGHAQAVGLTITKSNVDGFVKSLAAQLDDAAKAVPSMAPLRIDTNLSLGECTMELVDFVARCEPFGSGNKRPVWMIPGVVVTPESRLVGRGHLKLHLRDRKGGTAEGIFFNWTQRGIGLDSVYGLVVDLAVTIKKGYYLERHYPEIQVMDMREHEE
ncbi:MAG: single-stranded-DNA-specific exonuclease RecJ, partial [Candidatus Latescibacterota bacterium]